LQLPQVTQTNMATDLHKETQSSNVHILCK